MRKAILLVLASLIIATTSIPVSVRVVSQKNQINLPKYDPMAVFKVVKTEEPKLPPAEARVEVVQATPPVSRGTDAQPVTKPNMRLVGNIRITAYTLDLRCVPNLSGRTASGEHVQSGVTVAAWRDIPLGTKIYIEGIGYRTVQDRPSPKMGKVIDMYVGSYNEAIHFGVKYQKVYIVEQ